MWKAIRRIFTKWQPEPRTPVITVERNGPLLFVEVWIDGGLHRRFDFMIDNIVHVGSVDAHVVGKHLSAWHFTVHIGGVRKIFGVTLPISNSEEEQVQFCHEITKARRKFIRCIREREHERI